MLRVSNTAHLPTKPGQVAKAGRLEKKPKPSIKFSTFPKQKREQNKEFKTSLLCWEQIQNLTNLSSMLEFLIP